MYMYAVPTCVLHVHMYTCTYVPEKATAWSSMEIFHPVLGEVDIQTVEESSKTTSNATHHYENDEVIGIPQLTLILYDAERKWITIVRLRREIVDWTHIRWYEVSWGGIGWGGHYGACFQTTHQAKGTKIHQARCTKLQITKLDSISEREKQVESEGSTKRAKQLHRETCNKNVADVVSMDER